MCVSLWLPYPFLSLTLEQFALETGDPPGASAESEFNAAKLSKTAAEKERKAKLKSQVAIEHTDIIKDDFWKRRPWILTGTAGRLK